MRNKTKIKIDKVPLVKKRATSTDFQQFVTAVSELKLGESFLYKVNGNHRIAINTVKILLSRQYVVNPSEQKGYFRVGRTW